MRDSHPQPLSDVLDDSLSKNTSDAKGSLQAIQRTAKAILQLNRTVKSLLPAEMKPMCRVANYRNHILIIEVANASWLNRMNYEKPNIVSALRSTILPSLSSIDIRINPVLMTKKGQNSSTNHQLVEPEQKSNPRRISAKTAEQLLVLAERSPKKLKEKFERLAALAGESTNAANRKR
ncbi:DUF721 domain-containing protein [Moellerella wisconsensis]|uniref:DUF721 domain-containing protein n=1 Tax=Moellerella wisconsensis ATCC 35017 TaxID=1354267 RepID=A0A0N0IB23_9GAMM|nr:DciA family protein [Moellerella wisconsensis]KPD03241.1 hypothetical protein M992_1374 [Moellerella wisconsensis ATCC 35017]VFS48872.1 Protein of uncharacterised function (DUF721) [Moellerella wisconsensis]